MIGVKEEVHLYFLRNPYERDLWSKNSLPIPSVQLIQHALRVSVVFLEGDYDPRH